MHVKMWITCHMSVAGGALLDRTFDAADVAVAERFGLPLVATDERLARSGGHRAEVVAFSG
jgi:predicted nucleic acid-binding protein